MQRLDEIQSNFRDAVIRGDAGNFPLALVGGRHPEKRLTVHQRNYQTSLTDAVLTKFPATGWLVGTALLMEAARSFIRQYPPQAPCIAEYGAMFPEVLGCCSETDGMPYLREFAELEWYVGKAAIAVEQPAIDGTAFSAIDINSVPDAFLTLQPGVHYQHATWPIDELMTMFLTGAAPDQFNLTQAALWIEVRGARGAFELNRLEAAEFLFRKSVWEGHSIGDAAEDTLDIDGSFDPGRALASLFNAGLVTGLRQDDPGR